MNMAHVEYLFINININIVLLLLLLLLLHLCARDMGSQFCFVFVTIKQAKRKEASLNYKTAFYPIKEAFLLYLGKRMR
jgi:hypothetical protein